MSAQPVQQTPSQSLTNPPQESRQHLRVMPIPTVDPEPLTPDAYRSLTSPEHGSSYSQAPLAVVLQASGGEEFFGPQPTATTDLPDPQRWATQALRVILEVMDGSRPARQLNRWVT
ncbi:MAG: Rv3235 family protein, partial [Ornithinimicrobium sp.]